VLPLHWSQPEDKLLDKLHNGAALRALLEAAKGQSMLAESQLVDPIASPEFLSRVEAAGLLERQGDHKWLFGGPAKIQVAMRAIQLGQPERSILDTLTWQEFEDYVAAAFDFHDFDIHRRFRFATTRRYEIDVVATRKPILFCVDCKHYGIRLGKSSALRVAVEEQIQRTEALAATFAAHQAALNCTGWHRCMLLPVLVTMLNEDLIFHEQVPIVPAARLNAFLLSYDQQMDVLRTINAEKGRQSTLA
jgi:Holliday junction resolvase-like predicted endonuclease